MILLATRYIFFLGHPEIHYVPHLPINMPTPTWMHMPLNLYIHINIIWPTIICTHTHTHTYIYIYIYIYTHIRLSRYLGSPRVKYFQRSYIQDDPNIKRTHISLTEIHKFSSRLFFFSGYEVDSVHEKLGL